jgi:hypothetical protein
MHSHRAAQGVIYADQLKKAGKDVTINMSGDFYNEDFNEFDELYIYHGNDWSGSINLFGGLEADGSGYNFANFSQFKGKVYSLIIDCPDYYTMLHERIKRTDPDRVHADWNMVNWKNLKRMQDTAEVIDPNLVKIYDNAAMGDSHAICMYRPGWMNKSVPFKTLHGALKAGLNTFLPADHKFKKLEFYFGNIDVRHHLLRQPDPEQAVIKLVDEYFKQASEFDAEVTLYELLPIEHESRQLPKTGWYKGTPFFGSWKERDNIRKFFRDECRKRAGKVKFFEWVTPLMNSDEGLDFEFMEKPKSVHLSRAFYPHWSGEEWNRKGSTLDAFF